MISLVSLTKSMAIDSAVNSGVEHILFLSAVGTHNTPEPNVGASYFAGEQQLIKHARKWTILRMSYYAESFAQEAVMSLQHGVITGVAENKVSFVSRDDLAAAAAGILTTDGHDGATYNGTGPRAITGAERAAAVAKVSGKPFAFVTMPAEALEAQFKQAGLPPEVVRTIISIQKGFVHGEFDIVTGDIEKLSGKKPRSLEELLIPFFKK